MIAAESEAVPTVWHNCSFVVAA